MKAIDGVSFTVGRHELFAVIGPNGAGKTSIFNVISGVYRPQSGAGDVFDGADDSPAGAPHAIAALGIARTFQNVELFANLTVLDNLMLGRHNHIRYGPLAAIAWLGRARREEIANRAAVEEIVDFLELEQWRRLPVGLLPYGVQKRVELGRALAMEPKLLLLDEPVGRDEPRGDRGHGPLHPRHPRRARHPDPPGRARHGTGHGPGRPGDGRRLRRDRSPPARRPRSSTTRT